MHLQAGFDDAVRFRKNGYKEFDHHYTTNYKLKADIVKQTLKDYIKRKDIGTAHKMMDQDKVRDTYASTLEEKGRDKTTYAIIADVRQAFYITNEKRKPENAHTDMFGESGLKIIRKIAKG